MHAFQSLKKQLNGFNVNDLRTMSPIFFHNVYILLSLVLLSFRCFSYVGKVIANGQNVSIGSNCDALAIVEHEILHALGFYHEQSRYDRDTYVTIQLGNIQTG